jgi:nucleoid DNA-binding protein
MTNKLALIHKINKITGVTLRDASVCIDVIFEVISDAIARGERIELRGFGSFFVKETAAKKTVFANVPAHGRVFFRPCQKLKMSVWNRVKK